MGLLGVFATIFTGGNLLSDYAKDSSFNSKSKTEAIRNGDITWMDSHGNHYMVSTGEKVYTYDNKLRSVKDGRVIIDYELERTRKINQDAIKRAKEKGEIGTRLIYPEYKKRLYFTEFSTNRRYYLEVKRSLMDKKAKYYKKYYKNGSPSISSVLDPIQDETIEISEETFVKLGGYTFSKPGYIGDYYS